MIEPLEARVQMMVEVVEKMGGKLTQHDYAELFIQPHSFRRDHPELMCELTRFAPIVIQYLAVRDIEGGDRPNTDVYY